jgi:hypothetical protein
MRVYFGQVYIEQGAEFPFTCDFQRYISQEVTSLVKTSSKFIEKYGDDFKLGFNVSAKHELEKNEVRGPSVFRKAKDVEYTIFLPFAVFMQQPDPRLAALGFLFQGVYDVFRRLEIDSSKLQEQEGRIIQHICSNSEMFESETQHLASQARNGPNVGPPVWHATPEIETPDENLS